MLTDLTFLQQGKKWPPPCELGRLNDYEANRQLFENEHSEVYREQMKRIERVIGNFGSAVSFPVLFNYQRLMALKMADLVFGEPPAITIADDEKKRKRGEQVDDARQRLIDRILLETGLLESSYMAAIDISRFGDGILVASKHGNLPIIDVTTPAIWYAVVDKTNIKRVLYHVLAYQYLADESRKEYHLKVQIHKPDEPGACEEHTYRLEGSVDGFTIGAEMSSPESTLVETELDVCPVFRVSNVLTSDRIYGLDDYSSIDSIISELIVRVSQISRVLDVHANPSMSGPETALEKDALTGQWRLRVGDYYPRMNADDPVPEYIVWDASLEANFKQIELLINQLYSLSEMGAALFGDLSNKTGQVPSGSALRRLMIAPLAKARRIANKFDPVLKQIISLCASLYGTEIKPEEISIAWNDGLPNDEVEMANLMATRTGGKPTISQFSAIQRLDRLSAEDAESELEEIREDSVSNSPIALGTIDQHEEEPLPEDGET